MNPFYRLLILTSLLVSSHTLFADETGYEVEIIIFKNTNDLYLNSENWPDKTPIPGISDEPPASNSSTEDKHINTTDNASNTDSIKTAREALAISAPTAMTISPPIDLNLQAEMLKPDQFKLAKQAEKLMRNRHYQVLIHTAWRQAGLPQEKSFPVHINSLEYNKNYSAPNITAGKTSLSTAAEQHPSQENTSDYIDGNVTLVMSRYLHININLDLHKKQDSAQENIETSDNNPGNKEKIYTINIERRMKSKEIHYIDHPLVGILVLATPFKIESPETATDSNTIYKTIN